MKLNFSLQGQGPAVILLHGLFGSLSNLGGLARALASDFSVYQLDLRNHGASPHNDAMDYACMAEDVIELMNAQNIPHASLLGHSMGGKVAMQIALTFPHRVSKLIIVDIAPVTYPPHHNPILAGLQKLEQTHLPSRQTADHRLAEYVDDAQIRSFLLKNLIRRATGGYGLKLNLKAITNHYKDLEKAPTGAPFKGPTLFIKGMDSAYIQNKHRHAILALFPNARVQILSGTGHWPHSEKPDAFNRLVRQFLMNAETLSNPP